MGVIKFMSVAGAILSGVSSILYALADEDPDIRNVIEMFIKK